MEPSRRGLRRSLLARLFTLSAGSKQFQQHGVAFTVEFFNGAVGYLFLHAVDNRLLNLGTESVIVPRSFTTWLLAGEVLHESGEFAPDRRRGGRGDLTHHSQRSPGPQQRPRPNRRHPIRLAR